MNDLKQQIIKALQNSINKSENIVGTFNDVYEWKHYQFEQELAHLKYLIDILSQENVLIIEGIQK